MTTWLIRAVLLALGALLGYGLVFTVRFMAVVLPHGGMW